MSSQDNIIKFEEARRNVRPDRSASASRSRAQRSSAPYPRTRSTGSPVPPRRGSAPYGDMPYDSAYDQSYGQPYDRRQGFVPSSSRYSTRAAGSAGSGRAQSRQDRSLRNHNGYVQNYGRTPSQGYQHPQSAARRQHTYQDPFQGLYREYRENYHPENEYSYDLGFDQEPMPQMDFDPYSPYGALQDDYASDSAPFYGEDEPRGPVEARFDRTKREENKRKRNKLRAAKQFFKQFGDKQDSEEGNSRAALYEYEMGTEHKRAYAQLSEHQEEKNRSCSKSKGEKKVHKPFYQRKLFKVSACVLVGMLAIGAFLYPGAQQYYIEMRNHDRVQAEYKAVVERNEALQNDVDHLQTDEGIQDAARTDLGLVGEGENAVVVTDLPEDIESTSGTTLHPQIPSGSVEAPETWYSKFLDPFFGYSTVAQV